MKLKRKAILLWAIYFLNLLIVPKFFIVQTEEGQWQVNRHIYILLQLVTTLYALWSYREILIEGAKKIKGKHLGRDIAIGYVSRIVLTVLLAMVVPIQKSDNQTNVEVLLASTSIFAMFLLTCVVAPVVEELVFREGIIGAFKDVINPWVLAIISLVAFTALHAFSNQGGINWQDALLYVPLTLPLVGIYRHYQDNVVASITMHFVSNAIALLFLVKRM